MKILYIGQKIEKTNSGADVVNRRNQFLLEDILGTDNVLYIPIYPKNGFWNKYYFGITKSVLQRIKRVIELNKITHVFISQSISGRAAWYVKQHFPEIRVITFFHNVESDYADEYFRVKGIKTLPFYCRAKAMERKSVRFSDSLITLNRRDSERLYEIYKRSSSLELPTSFEDEFDYEKCMMLQARSDMSIDYLFVGVAFFPNIQGVQWFIDNVMPKVQGHLYVVGKGMDKVQFNNLSERIHVLGFVDDLSAFYYRAKVVISPIFYGAGMKTKTAEALMYGRTVIGTTEAFEGYDIDNRCMRVANDTNVYLLELNNSPKGYNSYSRQNFLENHETNALKQRMTKLLC